MATDPYRISTDPREFDLDAVHGFLATAYWSPGIPRAVVERAIAHSTTFGLFRDDVQLGFARVVSDRATFAYLCDVFVLPEVRGRGLGRWLVEVASTPPELQGLRRWLLATRDAHGLYRHAGFAPLDDSDLFMERTVPDIYLRGRERAGS